MAHMLIAETMFRGDCRLIRVQVVTEDPDLDPSLYEPVGSLSGWEFTCTGKVSHDDTDAEAIFQKTLGDGIAVIDNIDSIIEITIEPADTAALVGATTKLYIDVQGTDTDGAPWTLGAGRLIVRGDVTRS